MLSDVIYEMSIFRDGVLLANVGDFVNITVAAAPLAIANAGTDINIVLPTN